MILVMTMVYGKTLSLTASVLIRMNWVVVI